MTTPQTVLLVGATGAVGRPTTRALLDAGHVVKAVVRVEDRAPAAAALGAEPVVADIFDADGLTPAMAGVDAVVNLATRIPSPFKAAMPGAWKENDRIRTEASRALVDAALASDVGTYVQESIAFIYEAGGDEWIDEDHPVDLTSIVTSTMAAEANAARFGDHGGAGVVLRFGLFYGAGTAHTDASAASARKGLALVTGAPDAYQPSIHLDDAASAVVAALAVPTGIYNVVDDEPLRKAAYSHAIAAGLGVKDPHLPPQALVKLGGKKLHPISRSQRVSNRRFKEASGWSPTYPSVVEGWAQVGQQLQEREASSRG